LPSALHHLLQEQPDRRGLLCDAGDLHASESTLNWKVSIDLHRSDQASDNFSHVDLIYFQ